jgi:hypothetical protein
VPFSLGEIRRIHNKLTHTNQPADHTRHWSRWRRTHQARARHCHYTRRHHLNLLL